MAAKSLIFLSQLCSNIVSTLYHIMHSCLRSCLMMIMLPTIFVWKPFFRTKFSKFACVLFFCCYFVVFHKIVAITASSNSRTSYGLVVGVYIVHLATLALSFFGLPAGFFLPTGLFQISNIMVNFEPELYCP